MWVERMVGALDPLIQTATGQSYGVPPVPNEEYRMVARLAKSDNHAKAYFDHLLPSLNADPGDFIDLLCQHPGINSNLGGRDSRETFIVMPSSGWLRQLDMLARYLTKSGIKNGCWEAVVDLERFLSMSAQGCVPGYEIFVFRGLTLSGELEIVPGLEIIDYGRAAERGLVRNEPPGPTNDMPDYAAMGAMVLAREMTWGPCLVPPLSGRDRFPSPAREFRWSPGCGTDICFEILSLCTSQQVQVLSVLHCAPELVDIDRGFGPGSGAYYTHSEHWTNEALTGENIGQLQELLGLWSQFNPDKRDILELAVSRLSSSLYRNRGRFWVQDRILDAAIALEIMYELKPPELTNKLASRAAHLLAEEIDSRIDIFDEVHEFYDARSKIAHGGKGRGNRKTKTIDFKDTAKLGIGLGAKTFHALLDRGDFPDWKRLILSP